MRQSGSAAADGVWLILGPVAALIGLGTAVAIRKRIPPIVLVGAAALNGALLGVFSFLAVLLKLGRC